jgi:hypothetical protein
MKSRQKKKEYDSKRYWSQPEEERRRKSREKSQAWRRKHGIKKRVIDKERVSDAVLDQRALAMGGCGK